MSLLRDDLLNPLANPKGEDLRYSPLYDKIREARTQEEDDAPPGGWQRELKKADFATVANLAGDSLAAKSKDLQLAAWLGEALVHREGLAAVPECLQLFHNLQLQFWDTLYPELEDGNPELRATPQEWFASCCDRLLRRVPLTANGFDWLKYKESRAVGYESTVADNENKRAKRDEDIKFGKLAPEEFDASVRSTPRDFYLQLSAHLENSRRALAALDAFCREKYGDVAPSFSRLTKVLEELQQTGNVLLRQKNAQEPQEIPAPATALAAEEKPWSDPGVQTSTATSGSLESAIANLGRITEYLRKLDPSAVAPYLLTRSLRWGELRSAGDSPDPQLLVAPSTETRQNLRRLHQECEWEELLAAAESVVLSPCGRAWLDVHRYAWNACIELSFSAAARAICSELKALLSDFPGMTDWVLNDDTPVANSETKTWIREHVIGQETKVERQIAIPLAVNTSHDESQNGTGSEFAAAMQLARDGRLAEAIESLYRQTSGDGSAREKFVRRLQISQLCMETGQAAIAYPILHDLFSEIERRQLLDWESADFLVPPLAMLVQCIDSTSQDPQQRSQIYNLLCRLRPTMALQLQAS
ncbi:MAG TPA: type VI secretion system protein TssA [Candidatus Angelobacter sp.]|nr:type VI secretion system protein TssA [Candidatus Angelobacter sp.]